MANQYVNKVIVNNEIKMDLTEDTITPKTLRKGFTAHDASGAPIVGNESLTDISEDGTNAGPILELNAEGWAEQEQYLGVNLLPFPYTGGNTTDYGVTVTVNDDQSVTFSGSFTGSSTDSLKWSWYGEAGATNNLITPPGATAIKYITVADKSYNRRVVMVFYDSSGNELVSYSGLTNGTSYSIPSNASGMYIYEMITKLSNTALLPFTASIMLSAGTTTYPYEPYVGGKPSPSPELPQKIKVARGRNLIDESKSTIGYRLDASGQLIPIANCATSDFIEVEAGADYYVTNGMGATIGRVAVFFDSSKTFISAVFFNNSIVASGVITAPLNATYVRIDYFMPTHTNYVGPIQLEKGSIATPYVPYGYLGMEVQGKNLADYNGVNNVVIAHCTAGTTYTFSLTAPANRVGVNLKNGNNNGTTIASGNPYTQPITFTPSSDCDLFMNGFARNSGEMFILLTSEIQLELGTEATEYEPYYHKTLPVPLPEKGFAASLPDGTTDILKIDGAGGCTWVENTAEITFDGDEVWYVDGSGTDNWFFRTDQIQAYDWAAGLEFYASHYIPNTILTTTDGVGMQLFRTSNDVSGYARVRETQEISVEDFVARLAQNPLTVLYKLANPTTEQAYINNWDNDFPLGCTIDIPELRNLNVEYFLYDSITQLADDYYDRTTNDISEAMSQTLDSATHEALAAIAPIEGDISSANYLVGAYLIHDNQLCEVTTPIATGEAITVGTNIVISSIATEFGELQVAVQDIIDDPYILPTMSASEKGGAKVGQGLRIDNDILSVDMSSSQVTDAGPLISLQADGWAEQTQYSGKNLIPEFENGGINWSTGQNANSSTRVRTVGYVEVAENTTYTLSIEDGYKAAIRMYAADGTDMGGDGGTFKTSYPYTFTTPSGVSKLRFLVGYTDDGSITASDMGWIQFELGSTATSYEPYTGGIPSPNPDYPQEIRVARGRNLIDESNLPSSGHFLINYYSIALPVGQYVISFDVNSFGTQTRFFLYVRDSDGQTVLAESVSATAALGRTSIRFTTVTVSSTLSLYFNGDASISNIQLEAGSEATPYVPYGYFGMEVDSPSLNDCHIVSKWELGGFNASTGEENPAGSSPNRIRTTYSARIPVVAGDIYTLTTSSNYKAQVYIYDSSGTYLGNRGDNFSEPTHKTTFTMPANAAYVRLLFGRVDNAVISISETLLSQVQLFKGNIAYPYFHQTIPIPLPSKGFAAALPDGTSDILKIDGAGKWEWESKTDEVVLDGSETWTLENSGKRVNAPNVISVVNPSVTTVKTSAICSHFLSETAANTWLGDIGMAIQYGTLRFADGTGSMTVADWKTWLQSNPVTVLYPLANHTVEQGYLDNWDNDIPLHATIDIPELRNIGVECYMDEQASTLNAQWSERLRSEMDSSATNAVTESLASLAPVENDISSANYPTGSYLIHNNQLYKVTTAIATGEAISTNTNITSATIANELLDIDSDLLDFSELLEAAKAEYREKFQAIDSWQAAASQLIREDNGYYSNESITRMLAQRFDGKLYGYSEPKTTAVAITKTGANASLANPTLGTATVAGSSAYRHLGPFQWFAAKGIVDSDGVPHVSTIKGIDSDADWNADTNNVWSLRPIQWYSIDSTGGTVIGSLSDTWHLGLKPNPQAYLPDGTLRPYMLAPRYALGFENGVGVSKSGLKGYGRDVSHNSLITKLDYANTGYSGKTIYENWYDIFMSRMIYGTKDFQTIMQGCTSYNYQYHPSVAEQDTTRVILSNANAANLVVGSTMMMGNQATESTDRNNVNAYNIFDGLIIESIIEYDANNKSIELATDATFNTDPAYLFSTAPWHSGSCDAMDWDGSPTNPQSAKECVFFQGCELMTGVYEVLANIILKSEADARQIPYIVYSSRDDATSVTANFVKCGDGLLSNDGTATASKYPLYIADHNGLLYGEEVGGSTTAGCADAQYVRADSVASDSEWLSVGVLWNGRNAGLSYVDASHGLGITHRHFWSRLSPVGLSRG